MQRELDRRNADLEALVAAHARNLEDTGTELQGTGVGATRPPGHLQRALTLAVATASLANRRQHTALSGTTSPLYSSTRMLCDEL
jgi:hypothetical protein